MTEFQRNFAVVSVSNITRNYKKLIKISKIT